jgi:outer membrane protein assembly factor BamB
MSDSEPITSCFIYCNTATGYGGGIYNWGSISTITNCTIGANTAGNNGGGVYNTYNDSPTLVNCVLWGNSDSTGMGELAQMQGLTPGVFYSCIQDDDPNDGYIAYGGETNHNIDDNPLFVRDPNDGGDGWGAGDNDDFGDLHLQSGSPCVDTGDPYLPILPQETDIDGEARLMGGRVDMGADEFLVPVLPTIAVTKPDEGAVWACESIHQIEWSSYGAGYVDILFSSDDGNNWQEVDNGVEDACSYTWHLPDGVDSNQCLVLVAPSVPDANVVCIESGLFTIHPDSPGPPIVSKWESLGGDYDRKGLSDNYGPVLGCVKWEFEVDGAISASVTVGPNDTVYVPCEDGNLYKLDANGVVLWTYEANSPLITSPSIGPDGTVYVGAENGRLHAVDIDGNLRWTHGTGGMVYSSPAVSADGNTIFVGSQDGKLYALGNDGSELWSFETDGFGVAGGAILSSPSIGSNGTVYVAGLYDPNLYALDPNDGSVKWVCHFDSKGWPFASPVVAPDGTIYQTLVYDSNLYAIEPNDGSVRWATNLSDIWKQSSDSYSRWFEPCYYLSYRCSIVHGHAHFHYYEAQYDVSESGFSEPVLGPDGTIYVSLDDPYVRAVEPNGTIKWIRKPGPRSTYTETDGEWGWGWYDTSTRAMGGFGLTVGSNGSIYAASNDGNLYVINPDGFEIARFDSNDYWLAFPVVSADNTLIVGDSRDNSMLISYENNKLWAVADKCQGQDPNLCWQGGAQDLRGDGTIDFIDFSILGQEWLKCTDCCPLCPCYWDVPFLEGDINRDFYVDFADLSMLAEQWLSGH